jgi:hypothetical protein
MFEMEHRPSDPLEWLRKNLGLKVPTEAATKDL